MSAPQLNSNSNSSLISTLTASSDALVNPFDYSVDKILPFGASYTTKVDPVQGGTGTFGPSSVIDFDLPKWGFLKNVCLNFGLLFSTAPANPVELGALSAIDHIEILSSSRRILNLSYKDIMCLYSEYPNETRKQIMDHLSVPSSTATIANYNNHESKHYSLVLPFHLFFQHNLNPNLLFQEPLRIRVHLANLKMGRTAQDAGTHLSTDISCDGVYDPNLVAEYFNLPRELEDKTIESNYSSGSLSTIVMDFHDENEVVGGENITDDLGYNDTRYIECEIKDVGVVNAIYFMLSLDADNFTEGTGTAEAGNRLKATTRVRDKGSEAIVRVELSTNGQVIYSKTGTELRTWGHKSDGSISYPSNTIITGTTTPLCNVYKIDMGLSDQYKDCVAGGVSLRELHNVRLKVWYRSKASSHSTHNSIDNTSLFPANATTPPKTPATLKVMLKKYNILTCESSSGRILTSVAN